MNISEEISELIKIYVTSKHNPEQYKQLAQELNILPILFDWTGFIGIRPDCTYIYYDEENNQWKPEHNRAWQITALVDGSKRYKQLKKLLPEKTEAASDCPECNATGHLVISGKVNEKMICGRCFGLGWTNNELEKLKL